MKPERIILIRHGESEGNVDHNIYNEKPDYQLQLTSKGKMQALKAGNRLKSLLEDQSIFFYVSPYWRTRETFKNIVTFFARNSFKHQEDPRIREQEWGHLRSLDDSKQQNEQRDNYGTFYYRLPDGESGADVYDRMATFFESIHRDFQKEDFPENCVIVTHGMAIRLFLMKWFHWTVEEFEDMRNPGNCDMIVLKKTSRGKYELETRIEKYDYTNKPGYKIKNHNPLIL